MSATYQGNCNTLHKENPVLTCTGQDGVEGTIEIRGKLALVKEALGTYAVGNRVYIFGYRLRISKWELRREPGGLAALVVTGTNGVEKDDGESETDGPTPSGGTETDSETKELDFTLQSKPLETFKSASLDIAALFADPSTDAYKSLARWLAIKGESKFAQRWGAFQAPTEESATQEGGPDPETAEDWESLSGAGLKYAQKVAAGVEDYLVCVPVVRKTTQTVTAPSAVGSDIGKRSTPPSFSSAANAWLKTADTWIKDRKLGKWTHREEWTGFASLDSDLYPSS